MPIDLVLNQIEVKKNNSYVPIVAGRVGEIADLSPELKGALLQLAQKVAYVDDQGQTYYQALHDALYPPMEVESISAVYTQSGTVYDTDSLDSLKDDLVVTAHYSDSSTQTVPAADYTLSGTLTAGTSAITVSYVGKTATFNVTVETLTLFDWDYTEGTDKIVLWGSGTAELQSDGVYLSGGSAAWSAGILGLNFAPPSGPFKVIIDYTNLTSISDNSAVGFTAFLPNTFARVILLRQMTKATGGVIVTRVTNGSDTNTLDWNLTDSGSVTVEYDDTSNLVRFIQGSNEASIQAVEGTITTRIAMAQTGSTSSKTASVKIHHIRIERRV